MTDTACAIPHAAVLHDLHVAISRHQADPTSGNLPVVRILRDAGLTWSDLLAQPGHDLTYTIGLIGYGHGRTSGLTPADFGAAVLRLAPWCTPYLLAVAAVAAHMPSTDPVRLLYQLDGLVLDLVAARKRGGAGPHPIVWTPCTDAAAPNRTEC